MTSIFRADIHWALTRRGRLFQGDWVRTHRQNGTHQERIDDYLVYRRQEEAPRRWVVVRLDHGLCVNFEFRGLSLGHHRELPGGAKPLHAVMVCRPNLWDKAGGAWSYNETSLLCSFSGLYHHNLQDVRPKVSSSYSSRPLVLSVFGSFCRNSVIFQLRNWFSTATGKSLPASTRQPTFFASVGPAKSRFPRVAERNEPQ